MTFWATVGPLQPRLDAPFKSHWAAGLRAFLQFKRGLGLGRNRQRRPRFGPKSLAFRPTQTELFLAVQPVHAPVIHRPVRRAVRVVLLRRNARAAVDTRRARARRPTSRSRTRNSVLGALRLRYCQLARCRPTVPQARGAHRFPFRPRPLQARATRRPIFFAVLFSIASVIPLAPSAAKESQSAAFPEQR